MKWGGALRNNYLYNIIDNTGDNISIENPYWGELTGLYWIWKNYEFKDDDIIGFGHYNKILDISENDVQQKFNNGIEWIALKPFGINAHTYTEDIKVLREVIKTKFPKYLKAWDEIYDERGAGRGLNCSGLELFYTTKTEFNNYCKYLFDILFEVKEIIRDVDRSPYDKRYLAFLGERLLSVYLKADNKNVFYCKLNKLDEIT